MALAPTPGATSGGGADAAIADPTPAERRQNRRQARREPNRKRRRRLALAAFTCWSLGVAALSVSLGHMLFDRYAVHASPNVALPASAIGGASNATQDVVMPDVAGLSRDRALETLADAGFDPEAVTFSEKPYAAAPGTIVSQDPLRGSRNPTAVRLTTAVGVTMPSVAGQTANAASATLQGLGARVRTEQVYSPQKSTGTVVDTTPAAGEALVGDVTIRVASDPSAVFLATLRSTRSDCSSTSATFAGKSFDHAFRCFAGSSPSTMAYQLSKLAAGMQATIGLTDSSPTGSTARIVVVGDGQTLATADVGLGQTKDLNVSLDGVVQLEIRWTGTGNPSAMLGDPKLVGSADNINRLSQARP